MTGISAPSDRITAGFAFDAKNNVSILFGGGGQSDNPLGETWSYTLETNTWTDMSMVTNSGTSTPHPETIPLEVILIGIAIPLAAVTVVVIMLKRKE